MSGEGQRADHIPRGCSRLIGISSRLGWDGQPEAPGVLAESGHSNALLWRMLPYHTHPDWKSVCGLLAHLEFIFQTRYRHRAPSVHPSPFLTSPAKLLGRSG